MTSVRRVSAARACLVAYAVAAVTDVAAQVLDGPWLAAALPTILMPLLAAYLLLAMPRTRRMVILTFGLGFAWLGDAVSGDPLVMIGFFLVTQLAYCAAFAPDWRRSLLARPALLVAYAVAMLALISAVAAHAGTLAVPVVVYGLLVSTMVALAAGVNRRCGVGAVLFLASDLDLGYGLFVDTAHRALADGFVMATYLLGQLCIVLGVLASARGSRVATSGGLVSTRR